MKVYLGVAIVALAMMVGGIIAWAAEGEQPGANVPAEQVAPATSEGCAGEGCGSDACLDGVCCRQRCWGWVAGVEATYLKPNLRGDDAILDDGVEPFHSGQYAAFRDMVGSPRIWLGIEGERGWGVRGRYWDFNANTNSSDVGALNFPDFVDTLAAGNRMHVYAVDAEVTRRIDRGDWCYLGSFGMRNTGMKIRHDLDLFEAAIVDDSSGLLANAATSSQRQLDATGLTAALEARRPFGCSGLAFACNVRGSVLWGEDQAIGTSRILLPDTTLAQLAGVSEGTTQFIFETQLGVEWTRRVECLRGLVFAHVMFEYQRWTADERLASFCMTQAVVPGLALHVTSIEPNVDFTGIALGIGFTR